MLLYLTEVDMNHRVLFFLAITAIAVGIVGIFVQRYQNPSGNQLQVEQPSGVKVITIAEASRALRPYELIESGDYRIRTVEVDSAKKDIRDLSSLSSLNLNGYLVRNNIPEGSAIIPELIEAPGSKNFIMNSLRGNELSYGYIVKSREGYLLSSLKVGEKVSLFIRVIEVEKGKKSDVTYVPEGSNSPGKNMKKYALSPVLSGLSILDVQQEKMKEEKNHLSDPDAVVGKIILRMNQQQLADLRVVENAGELILFPAEGGQENNKKKGMDEVLPQFRAIKELRGGK
jgi:pilus assembly protein CpaB